MINKWIKAGALFLVLLLFHPAAQAAPEVEAGRSQYDLGVFAFDDGKYETALSHFLQVLEAEPDNAYCLYFMGKSYREIGEYALALESFQKAQAIDPEISGLDFDIALTTYKAGRFKQAEGLFADLSAKEPDNPLVNYYLGMSLYKQEKFQPAVTRLLDAADKNPGIRDNGYFFAGVSYQNLGEQAKAIEKFEYIKDNAESRELREKAGKWLDSIQAKKEKPKKPYSLFFKTTVEYDDNLRLDPVNEDIFTDEDDLVTSVYLSGKYNFINRSDLRLGAGYSHFQTWHADFDQFDLVGSTGSLYYQQKIGKSTVIVTYLPSYYWLDSDDYLRRHQIVPELFVTLREGIIAKFFYTYTTDHNFDDNGRNGHTNEAGSILYYRLAKDLGKVSGGLAYADASLDDPDEVYARYKASLGLDLNLPFAMTANVSGSYHQKDYDNVDTGYLIQRQDRKYVASLGVSRKFIYDWLQIGCAYQYTRNNSEISAFTYEKNDVTLGVTINM